jgi:hypothetical protein
LVAAVRQSTSERLSVEQWNKPTVFWAQYMIAVTNSQESECVQLGIGDEAAVEIGSVASLVMPFSFHHEFR